jgi:hypothetical protein
VGHQVNFFVTPSDLPDLEAAIRSTADVCFLAEESPAAQPVELDTIAPGQAAKPPFKYLIVQRKDLAAVRTRYSSAQEYWLIDAVRSPVIEFNPGLFSGSKLGRGRAYFASDLRFRPELPSPEFVRWGDRVLSRIRKKLTRLPEFEPPWLYFGANARQWIRDSGATMTSGAISFEIPSDV